MANLLSREQLTQIETLFAAGYSVRNIAVRVGCNKNTVHKHVTDPNFKLKYEEVRDRSKKINAVKTLKHMERISGLVGKSIQNGDAYAVKAATGAWKDLDQLNAVATGDDRQAGVPLPPPAPQDLKVLIATILGNA